MAMEYDMARFDEIYDTTKRERMRSRITHDTELRRN